MVEDEELTPEELEALDEMGIGYGYPKPEEKASIYSFFKKVIVMPDTTRTANLKEEELGIVKIPVRTLLNLSLYSKEMGLSGLGNYFFKESQVLTNSSLSRDGFLDKLAVTTTKILESKSKKPRTKKGWFTKKEPKEEYE